jgi:hypothetical protein
MNASVVVAKSAVPALSQSFGQSMEDIAALDLSMIKLKLQDAEEGPAWTAEKCDAVEVDYKRFLALKRAYHDVEIVPNKEVDLFWHQHILDTEKYAQDCELLFGNFLHHYPYFGMQGEEDYARLCAAFSETQSLYALHFGGKGGSSGSGKCRTKCKPVKCK